MCPLFHFASVTVIIDFMYEFFDHTADLGLRVRAADLDSLFTQAAECLYAAMLEDVTSVQPSMERTISITGSDREFLLFDWLRDLLLITEEDHIVFARFSVRVSDHGLEGTAWGEAFDSGRHQFAREVKAITYHELKVAQTADGWLAEVIVDI